MSARHFELTERGRLGEHAFSATLAQRVAPWRPLVLKSRYADGWLWAAYLLAITLAELLVALREPKPAIGLHLVLLLVLPVHATFAPRHRQPLLIALMFAPLVRIVSLALPLATMPMLAWLVMTSVPLFVAIVPAVRVLGLSGDQLGLRWGNPRVQLAIALLGLPFGTLEFLFLRPSPLASDLSPQAVVLPILVLLICTGVLEELIFRGILQSASVSVLGRWGLSYASAVFAALHLGYESLPDLALVYLIARVFAELVQRTGSIVGVTLAHGLTNSMLFVILPLVVMQAPVGDPPDGGAAIDSVSSISRPSSLPLPGSGTRLPPLAPPEDVAPRAGAADVESYVVQPGETLQSIAAIQGKTVETLATLNGMVQGDQMKIRPGQVILVPGDEGRR